MSLTETHRYDDIIDLPHHQSQTHAHMSMHNRAAQFMPFAALTGYDDIIRQTAQSSDDAVERVVPEKLRTLDHGRPWSDDQFASTRLSSNRDMSR